MRQLLVLSPHRDDAAFSLFISLTTWCALPISVKVSNFFTVSGYAPCLPSRDPGTVSAIRKREDRQALSRISRRIKVVDHDLVDAPLRLRIPVSAVCYQNSPPLPNAQKDLTRYIRLGKVGLCVAPLALGNHIDHLAVLATAVSTLPSNTLAFYEDLPYATWTEEQTMRQRVAEIEDAAHIRLSPFILRMPHAAARKRNLICNYRSQITTDEAKNIAGWTNNYGGGERIWIPRHSRRWPITG
jgi:hypothetical protein